MTQGPNFSVKLEFATDITYQMITSYTFSLSLSLSLFSLIAQLTALRGKWKQVALKPLNLDAEGKKPEGGHLHPILKAPLLFVVAALP